MAAISGDNTDVNDRVTLSECGCSILSSNASDFLMILPTGTRSAAYGKLFLLRYGAAQPDIV